MDPSPGKPHPEEQHRGAQNPPERLLGTAAALPGEQRRLAPDRLDGPAQGAHGRVVDRGQRRGDPPFGVTVSVDAGRHPLGQPGPEGRLDLPPGAGRAPAGTPP